jgi:hypothetical protein
MKFATVTPMSAHENSGARASAMDFECVLAIGNTLEYAAKSQDGLRETTTLSRQINQAHGAL